MRARILAAAAALLLLPGAAAAQQRGGSVTFLAAGDVDYIDPAQTYYTFGFQVQYAVNRALYSFRPDAPEPVPDLAAGPAEIAPDLRTITIRLRPGVRYAPPVNREVTSADVKYAFERAFSSSVPSGYAYSYFSDIAGAPSRPARGIPSIAGIETPDPLTIVFRLERPVAHMVAAALVLPITVPVPREYAAPRDARTVSSYDRFVAFTGPYMVRNDADGRLVGRRPGRAIELVRNPNWDPAGDFRPAYLDAIAIEQGNDDLLLASRRALAGNRMMCCDAGQPPISALRQALRSRPAQVGRAPSGGTRWISLNTARRPLSNANLRRAIVAGMNRRALRDTRGGSGVGAVAEHFLPPGLPGFAESGGGAGFADLDFMRDPTGNRRLARRYLRAAGYRGGRYRGRRLLAIATNADPGLRTARLAVRQLRRIGLRIRMRRVPQDLLYTRFCGVPRARVDICLNVGWFRDFNDPQSLLVPTFHGDAIVPQGNVNWSQLRVPSIDAAMDAAALLPAGPERNAAWARVNRRVVAQAPGVPYMWDDSFQLRSRDVHGPMNGYTTGWDLSFSWVE